MAPLSSVMTVLGPVAPDELGLTLPHEHLFIDLLREYRSNGLLNDAELAIRELELFRAAGGRTIVDCTSVGLARDPLRLRQVSQATDVRIVMGSSHYRVPYIDRDRLDRLSTDEVADEIVAIGQSTPTGALRRPPVQPSPPRRLWRARSRGAARRARR